MWEAKRPNAMIRITVPSTKPPGRLARLPPSITTCHRIPPVRRGRNRNILPSLPLSIPRLLYAVSACSPDIITYFPAKLRPVLPVHWKLTRYGNKHHIISIPHAGGKRMRASAIT